MKAIGATLGELETTSALGQPLEIKIVVSADSEQLTSLVARVGSMESYQRSGLVYSGFIADLRAWVDKTPSGQTVVKVVSINPISVPVFDLLIDLSWSDGRTTDSYTVFLDTPDILQARQSFNARESEEFAVSEVVDGMDSNSKEGEEPVYTVGSSESTEEIDETSEKVESMSQLSEESLSDDQVPVDLVSADKAQDDSDRMYGPVASGDTLGKIALQIKPSDISLEQMLVLLYRKNTGAFVGENMNRLRVGPVLELPTEADYSSIEDDESRKIVKEQYAEWRQYKEQLGGLASDSDDQRASPRQEVTSSVTSGVDESVAAGEQPREVLRLSEKKSSNDVGYEGSSDYVMQLEEELVAKDNAVREANARMARLEKTIKDLKGLIEVESGNLNSLGEEKNEADSTEVAEGGLESETGPEESRNILSRIASLILNQNISQLLDLPEFQTIRENTFFLRVTEYPIIQKILILPIYLVIVVLVMVIAVLALLFIRLSNLILTRNEESKVGASRSRNDYTEGSGKKNKREEGDLNVSPRPNLKQNDIGESNTRPDLSGISLDLDGADGKEDSKWYEVQTKFDLAKAYQEMGDREGALQILMEVLDEGDDDQIAAAKKTIAELNEQ